MNLTLEPYLQQRIRWPKTGKVILAQFDNSSVVVYQAFRPSIAQFAADHGYFGGGFKLDRMSWIKPGFLWMMYRSGWAAKEGQESILAVRLLRTAFDEILAAAVASSFQAHLYATAKEWKSALRSSNVRRQWDPDHGPTGSPLERRAIQLGLRGPVLLSYAREWIVSVEDITSYVHEQAAHVRSGDLGSLQTPHEEPYPVPPDLAVHLGMRDDPLLKDLPSESQKCRSGNL